MPGDRWAQGPQSCPKLVLSACALAAVVMLRRYPLTQIIPADAGALAALTAADRRTRKAEIRRRGGSSGVDHMAGAPKQMHRLVAMRSAASAKNMTSGQLR